MYTLFFRSAPHPLFTTFDAPDFQTVCTRRGRSNTPLQALTVANDEAFLEFSQALAARVLRESGWHTPVLIAPEPIQSSQIRSDTRLRRAYLLALCREPSPTELSTLRGYYHRQLADLTDEPDRAKSLLSAELADRCRTGSDPAPTAALVLVCPRHFQHRQLHHPRITLQQSHRRTLAVDAALEDCLIHLLLSPRAFA